ncbi:MAG: Hsp70 family protein, partial [Bryobacteraceae bacterium]
MATFDIDFGEPKGPIVGIDLGTTNSLIACMGATGAPQVIPSPDGGNIVPSIVSVTETGDIVVGQAAREALLTHSDRTVYSAKRLMGRDLEDVRDELGLFPFHLAEDNGAVIQLEFGGRKMTPPQVGAEVLKQLKQNAEVYLGHQIKQAVITVPAYFNDAQRQATKDAGRIAGLEVLRLVNEPTAASLAYGLDKRKEGIIAVYDLGGGTFDISILKLHDGIFEVLATNGDTHLGGDDIDNLLLQIALEDIGNEWAENLSGDSEGVQRLRRAVIQAKEELSYVPKSVIDLDYHGKRYQRELTRELYEQLITPIVDRTLGPCRQCIKDAGVTVAEIVEVVLVGGSTRIPLVRSAVRNLFQSEPHTELNPDEVVALGAAVQAAILSGDLADKLLLDVTPLSLGIETMGGVVTKLIHRISTIPSSAVEQFTNATDGQ